MSPTVLFRTRSWYFRRPLGTGARLCPFLLVNHGRAHGAWGHDTRIFSGSEPGRCFVFQTWARLPPPCALSICTLPLATGLPAAVKGRGQVLAGPHRAELDIVEFGLGILRDLSFYVYWWFSPNEPGLTLAFIAAMLKDSEVPWVGLFHSAGWCRRRDLGTRKPRMFSRSPKPPLKQSSLPLSRGGLGLSASPTAGATPLCEVRKGHETSAPSWLEAAVLSCSPDVATPGRGHLQEVTRGPGC